MAAKDKMPDKIALEPGKRKPLKVTLSGYEDLPDGQRPTFTFKRLSFRRFRDVASVYDGIGQNTTAHEAMDNIINAIQPFLMNWENVYGFDGGPVPYDPKSLEDVIDINEAKELLKGLMDGGVDAEARKNSQSPVQ